MAEWGVVWEAVDGVGSGTLAGLTYMGDGDRGFIYGCGRAVGWAGWAGMDGATGAATGAGAVVGGAALGALGREAKN